MERSDFCPDCGAARSEGVCPRCLIGLGLDAPSPVVSHFDPLPTGSVAVPGLFRGEEARYQLLGEIARGGMGAVLRGRDSGLGRDLAVKVLLERHRDKPEFVRRFVEEARIGGQLQHPGVVPIYELGLFPDRRPYFTMKLVRGQTLAELLAKRPNPAHELPRFLAVFQAVCQTMAYAHARGVIHRDLKPSNIMVGSFGEVQVMDWGLAKVRARESGHDDPEPGATWEREPAVATTCSHLEAGVSQAGSVLGTPQYMAPEQARGQLSDVDERSDVFALGAILCEILTSRPPYVGEDSSAVATRAAGGDTSEAMARLEASGAEGELVALARVCLAPAPDGRPRNAGAVATAMTAHLTGVAERLKTAERERAVAVARAAEERHRRKLQLTLAALLLASTVCGGLGASWYFRQRQARAARADLALKEAELLLAQARARAEDAAAWQLAEVGVKGAERTVADVGNATASHRLDRLREAVTAGAEAARRDHELLARLADVRSAKQDLGTTGADAAYAAAFRAAGLDLDALAVPEAAALLLARPPSVVAELASYLDDWSGLRQTNWQQRLQAARVADPDPFRDRVRAAVEAGDAGALNSLAVTAPGTALAPASALLLASRLDAAGAARDAVALLRKTIARHPDDVWVNYDLAVMLDHLPSPSRAEQVGFFRAARALRPVTSHELAHLLERMGRPDEAEAIWADLTERRPQNGRHLACYGALLETRRGRHAAAPVLHKAVAACEAALRNHAKNTEALTARANALRHLGNSDAAALDFEEVVRLLPGDASAHYNLGIVRWEQNRLDAAVAEYRAAIRLKPEHSQARSNLAGALRDQGRLNEAVDEYRELVRRKPDFTLGYYNLGSALAGRDEPAAAAAAYREAIRLMPGYAEAHCNLADVLTKLGDFAGALAEFRKGHELGSKRPGWGYPSASWVAAAERRNVLAGRLPAVLQGKDRPTHTEARDFAYMAQETRWYAAAARLWAIALAADPTLAADRQAQNRYNAACAAALAACGKGADRPAPDLATRARLRKLALTWLTADVESYRKSLKTATTEEARLIARQLRNWTADRELAGLRDPDSLAQLTEAERKAWQLFWTEIDQLRQKPRPAGDHLR